MKRYLLPILVAGALLCSGREIYGQDQKDAKAPEAKATETKATDAKTQLQELVDKIKAQLQAGKNTEADLAPLLKEFDTLLEQHKSEKTDDVARILFMKAMLYTQVLDNTEKGIELIKQVKQDFPDSTMGKNADEMIASILKKEESKKVKRSLAAGTVFPDFNEKDLDGKPLAIANFKGKIVLVDFWATWCGPCVAELPNVLKTYEKYHPKGFEILGISLDKDETALKNFLKTKGMTWPQYFDGKGWQNKLAQQYGVDSIPATYLLDGEGKIIAKDLRGEALETQVGKLLSKP
jgi:thiol-disulfide isomerase/thioredoxin